MAVRAKFHQTKCRGSWVIVFTVKKKLSWDDSVVAIAAINDRKNDILSTLEKLNVCNG